MSKRRSLDDEDPRQSGEDYEECPVCHQEFTGVCPINSAECPYAEEQEEEDEDDEADFDDVENLEEVLEEDEEADRLAEEGEDAEFEEEERE